MFEFIDTPNPNAKKIMLVKNSNLHDLFFHPGVENIFSGPGFLTVTKKDNFLWENIIQDLDS